MAKQRRRSIGFTFIEFAGVMALTAISVAATFYFYNKAHTAQRTQDAMADIILVVREIRTTYRGHGSYTGLSNAVLFNWGGLPDRMRGDASPDLNTSLGGQMTVEPWATDAGFFTVTFDSVPSEGCIKLTSERLQPFPDDVIVNGVSLLDGDNEITESEPLRACSNEFNTIVWRLR